MPFIDHHGARLHYELHGKAGEPVLFIQGVGVIGHGWQPQVAGLAAHHRILTFDNRGIGKSTMIKGAPFSIEQMADDARALMDAVGWISCHVAGHSMGGVIAERLAITHPHRVRSLALLCTVARGADAARIPAEIMGTALRVKLGPKASRRRAFLELIYPEPFLDTVDCDALAAQLAPLFGHDLATQPLIAVKQAMALRNHDCTSELPRLAGIPTLVVSATHDRIAPPRFGRQIAALIPGARCIEIPDASHGLPMHQADMLNRLIADFILEVSLRFQR